MARFRKTGKASYLEAKTEHFPLTPVLYFFKPLLQPRNAAFSAPLADEAFNDQPHMAPLKYPLLGVWAYAECPRAATYFLKPAAHPLRPLGPRFLTLPA